MGETNSWQRLRRRRLTRRTLLGASAKAGVGAAGLALVGCGDDDDNDEQAAVAAAPAAQAQQTADQAVAQAADEPGDDAAPAAGEPRIGGKIVVHAGGDPTGFDQYLNPGGATANHNMHTYPMLTQIKAEPGNSPLQFEPELSLAESVEMPDNQTFVFSIMPNAVWEDVEPTNGRPITAEDVAYTYTGEPYKTMHNNRAILLPHIDGVETPDDRTVRFNLNKPVAPFMLYMGHQSGPRVMPPEIRINEESRNRQVSGGPYKMVSYDFGSKVSYVRNENYFRGPRPYVDAIDIVFISDPSTRVSNYRSGGLDMTTLNFQPFPEDAVEEVKKEIPDATWQSFASPMTVGITIDIGLEPFTDKRVRQAISNSLDRDALLASNGSLESGRWQTGLSPLVPWWIDPKTDPELQPFFAHDLQRANDLLDAAGVSELPPLTLNTTNFLGPAFVERTQVVQSNLRDIGLETEIEVQDQAAFFATTFPGKHVGRMGHQGMVSALEPDETLAFTYTPDSPRSGIPNGELMGEDDELQGLLAEQLQTTDFEERQAVLRKLQLVLADRMYLIPGVSVTYTLFAQPRLQNVNFVALFAMMPTVERVWIDEA